MEITITNTSKIIHINGIPTRIWEGQTKSGIKIHCYITRIAIDKNELRTKEFESELLEQKIPSIEIDNLPTRLII